MPDCWLLNLGISGPRGADSEAQDGSIRPPTRSREDQRRWTLERVGLSRHRFRDLTRTMSGLPECSFWGRGDTKRRLQS